MTRYFLKKSSTGNLLIVCENEKQVNLVKLHYIFDAVPKTIPLSKMEKDDFREVTLAEMIKNKKLPCNMISFDHWAENIYRGASFNGVERYVEQKGKKKDGNFYGFVG